MRIDALNQISQVYGTNEKRKINYASRVSESDKLASNILFLYIFPVAKIIPRVNTANSTNDTSPPAKEAFPSRTSAGMIKGEVIGMYSEILTSKSDSNREPM